MKFLKLLIKIFHFFVDIRLILYQSGLLKIKKVESKVLSIGNISFGGTGKTPVTIKIAQNLLNKGFKIAIVSRGYKRENENNTAIVSDGKNISYSVNLAGDEPYLIAKKVKCPVIVGKNRYEACKVAIKNFSPDFIILDDGFQHIKLYRNKDIVLVSQDTLISDEFLLREPLKNLSRADIVIITKIIDPSKIKYCFYKLKKYTLAQIFFADFYIKEFKNINNGKIFKPKDFNKKKVAVFCAIAKPNFFKILLEQTGIEISEFIKLKDHAKFNNSFYKKINNLEENIIITTEKDAVKLNLKKLEKKDIFIAILDLKIYPV